jgi:hypothetical protein
MKWAGRGLQLRPQRFIETAALLNEGNRLQTCSRTITESLITEITENGYYSTSRLA